MIQNTPLVSILMPVFNGEKYLRKSLNSVIQQTYPYFELICIDDESNDKSYELISDISKTDNRVRLFRKLNEGCVPKSLNYALPFIKGDYVFYMSQDDILDKALLESMVNRAITSDADIIIPEMYLLYNNNLVQEDKCTYPPNKNYNLSLTGKEAFLLSIGWRIHGFYLTRYSLISSGWFDFSTNADEYTTRVNLLKANKVVFCTGKFYYFQGNPNAITKKITLNYFDWLKTDIRLEKLVISQFTAKDDILMIKIARVETFITRCIAFCKNKHSFSNSSSILKIILDANSEFCTSGYKISILNHTKGMRNKLKTFLFLTNIIFFIKFCSLYVFFAPNKLK
ncbi:glycosyltransferase family 2 protein [Paludibacter jiangxiensis]|uniref:Glycosyltransferase n=1 Tax=Paludibacter jiangxiensis TaxID=681398 RepID=A0A170Z3R6_9BACT|nr:glycosyltransferase family 2 protein [Paludibacter jiangxiensis]GAT62309.1 glycosyltransferase [Paludibacter jiangxiensis]